MAKQTVPGATGQNGACRAAAGIAGGHSNDPRGRRFESGCFTDLDPIHYGLCICAFIDDLAESTGKGQLEWAMPGMSGQPEV